MAFLCWNRKTSGGPPAKGRKLHLRGFADRIKTCKTSLVGKNPPRERRAHRGIYSSLPVGRLAKQRWKKRNSSLSFRKYSNFRDGRIAEWKDCVVSEKKSFTKFKKPSISFYSEWERLTSIGCYYLFSRVVILTFSNIYKKKSYDLFVRLRRTFVNFFETVLKLCRSNRNISNLKNLL